MSPEPELGSPNEYPDPGNAFFRIRNYPADARVADEAFGWHSSVLDRNDERVVLNVYIFLFFLSLFFFFFFFFGNIKSLET